MGTTSACAENTKRHFLLKRLKRNYLRVHGEYLFDRHINRLIPELPPRARRIRRQAHTINPTDGTTSACAENTGKTDGLKISGRNYLRMRGEYPSPLYMRPASLELPPHARRIPPHATHSLIASGTTSACAENTPGFYPGVPNARNYLRMRGEYVIQNSNKEVILELPPHARRIPRQRLIVGHFRGTTSACAENTTCRCAASGNKRNYLRMRGEYNDRWLIQYSPVELPPHARRIQALNRAAVMGGGTTSACAENTFEASHCLHEFRNYLRMRGEYAKSFPQPRNSSELPPHARRIL